MCVVPLPTWVNDAATASGDAGSDLVPGLSWTVPLYRQVDIVVGPPVGDLGNGFIDRSPWFQPRLLGIGRVGRCWKWGQSFARAVEMNCERSTMANWLEICDRQRLMLTMMR